MSVDRCEMSLVQLASPEVGAALHSILCGKRGGRQQG